MPLLPSPAIPADPSPQLKAALDYAKAMGETDINGLAETITDDYIHYIHPESLGFPPVEGKAAFVEFFGKLLPQFETYDAVIKELIETPGKVVCHATGEGKTKFGLDYKNEYIVVLYVRELPDGSFKVNAMKEFSDSKFTSSFMAAILSAAPPK